VSVVANICKSICYQNKQHLLAGMIVAGFDPVEGPKVYSIPLGGALIEEEFSIGGWFLVCLFFVLDLLI
jgi:20S proteasome subunit beta 1